MSKKREKCFECDGRGEYDCPKCHGDGECIECGAECKECDGDGAVKCEVCDGTGWLDGDGLPDYDGKPDTSCEVCGRREATTSLPNPIERGKDLRVCAICKDRLTQTPEWTKRQLALGRRLADAEAREAARA